MIPKIIHYCWFGKNTLPLLAETCINSWKQFCPDYQIIRWDEDNFNLEENIYIKEAHSVQKWAFITDYVRLKVLWEYGGIYMDTDVEVIRNLDEFLRYRAFSGYESNGRIPTGIMGSEPHNPWFQLNLSQYIERHFIQCDGTYDLSTNVDCITELTEKTYGVQLVNTLTILPDESIIFFPSDYFCPKDYMTGIIHKTINTYTIHHFSGSWLDKDSRHFIHRQQMLTRCCGKTLGSILAKTEYHIRRDGIFRTLKVLFNRLRKY